jgi:hypothetical protein
MQVSYSYDAGCYKFTGKERDSESDLDNFGARCDLLPAFRTKLSMISAKVNRSHFLSQARLEVRGSVSPFFRC